jgi:pimeloyl-ACP methyl ester carboxylesterase
LHRARGQRRQQAAFAVDMLDLMNTLGIRQAVIGGYDWGARTACIMAVLYPERVKALVSVSGYLIGSQAANAKPLLPAAEQSWWYQFYFATERGRERYAASRGYGRFVNGYPVDEVQHQTCFACHDTEARDTDWVFTRYAP